MKGRVACEISTGDELLLTEMIFNGAFNDLTVEQTVALLSCFVFEEKVCHSFYFLSYIEPPFKLCESLEQSDQQVRLKDELAGPLRIMQETARRISRVSNESKLTVDEEEYVNKFRSELMDVVYQWCNVLFSFLFLSFLSFHWLILFSESHPFFLLLFFVVFRVSNSQM